MEKIKSRIGQRIHPFDSDSFLHLQSRAVLLDVHSVIQKPQGCQLAHAKVLLYAHLGKLPGIVAAICPG